VFVGDNVMSGKDGIYGSVIELPFEEAGLERAASMPWRFRW
jgi:hypothetical protein